MAKRALVFGGFPKRCRNQWGCEPLGRVFSGDQRKSVHLLIETTPGGNGLDDHLADNESMYNRGYI